MQLGRASSLAAWLSCPWDFDYWQVPKAPVARPFRLDPLDDPRTRVRAQRLRAMIEELIPKVRRLNATMPEDQVIEMADSMAELRLLDEEIG